MIPYVPLHPNCLALRFKIYHASLTDTACLEEVVGYCLVIFQHSKLYYLKRTVNLKNYLSKLQSSLDLNNNELPQCVQNVLNKHRHDVPVTYYLTDANPETLYQIHNMLSPVGWVNITTPRGDRIKQMRELCLVRFNHDMYALVSCDDSATYEQLKDRALSTLSTRLRVMSRGQKFMQRLKNQLNILDVKTFLEKLEVIVIFKTSLVVPLSKVAPIIKAYNDDMVMAWANVPAWAWEQPLEIKNVQSYVNKYVKESRHVSKYVST